MEATFQPVEVYSNLLRIRGEVRLQPGSRLSDEVNRMEPFLHMYHTTTEPLITSYPVVSAEEPSCTVAKSSVVMVVPARSEEREADRLLWREKVPFLVVLNTTAFAMTAEIHLEPNVSLAQHLEHTQEFLPLTRINAIVVASMGLTPQTIQHGFALLNPASLVSFSVRAAG